MIDMSKNRELLNEKSKEYKDKVKEIFDKNVN